MERDDRPSSPPPGGAARTKLAPHRVTWRSRAAVVLRDALAAQVARGVAAASQRAVADRLGISHTAMQRLVGDGDPAIAFGDVLAMGASIAIPVLESAIEALRASAPKPMRRDLEDVAFAAQEAVGTLAKEVRAARADGHVDLVEVARIEAAAWAMKGEAANMLSQCVEIRAGLAGVR